MKNFWEDFLEIFSTKDSKKPSSRPTTNSPASCWDFN